MKAAEFSLDPRIAAETTLLASLSLCDVLLMNDARYPWLVLVPRRSELVEIFDLDSAAQMVLWRELSKAEKALRSSVGHYDKLNIAVLGNVVRQLHIHIVLRREDDEAWPAPVWGRGEPVPYRGEHLLAFSQSLRAALAT
jgi:diadenosine tetraphosphate (Ap4A) HIT family hydrolase